MAGIVISKTARKDLVAIRDYIQNELANPDSTTRIIRELEENILALSDMPQRGKPLDATLSVHTEYRFLICGNYRVFYLHDGKTVEIVRILHALQNRVRALFF